LTGQHLHDAYVSALRKLRKNPKHQTYIRQLVPTKKWEDISEDAQAVYNRMASILNEVREHEETHV
jgi:hypothetical protein